MYTNAQYIAFNGINASIRCDINGVTSFVPIDPANTDYNNRIQYAGSNSYVLVAGGANTFTVNAAGLVQCIGQTESMSAEL